MKIVAILCSVILFGFTLLVLVTDGLPRGAPYVVLTLLALLVPLFSSQVLLRHSGGGLMGIAAMFGNIMLLGFALWAIVSNYPHPEEEGVVAYTVLIILAPLLNLVAIYRASRAPLLPEN